VDRGESEALSRELDGLLKADVIDPPEVVGEQPIVNVHRRRLQRGWWRK